MYEYMSKLIHCRQTIIDRIVFLFVTLKGFDKDPVKHAVWTLIFLEFLLN